MTWVEALERLCEYMQGRNMAVATIQCRLSSLKAFVRYSLATGIEGPNEVSMEHCIRYKADLIDSDLYTRSTVDSRLYAVRLLFNCLCKIGVVEQNPLSNVRIWDAQYELPRSSLTEVEVALLLETPDTSTSKGVRDRAILEVFYSSGIRLSELVNLNKHDVDTARGYLTVRYGKNSADRIIPLGAVACIWVRMSISVFRDSGNPSLFVGVRSKTRIDKDVVYDMVRQYGKDAGIKKRVYPHILRHSMASHMLANGASSVYLQAILGHRELETTQIYTRVTQNQLRQIHERYHPRS